MLCERGMILPVALVVWEKGSICVLAGFPCSGKHDGFH